jgi:hypothetical protein
MLVIFNPQTPIKTSSNVTPTSARMPMVTIIIGTPAQMANINFTTVGFSFSTFLSTFGPAAANTVVCVVPGATGNYSLSALTPNTAIFPGPLSSVPAGLVNEYRLVTAGLLI